MRQELPAGALPRLPGGLCLATHKPRGDSQTEGGRAELLAIHGRPTRQKVQRGVPQCAGQGRRGPTGGGQSDLSQDRGALRRGPMDREGPQEGRTGRSSFDRAQGPGGPGREARSRDGLQEAGGANGVQEEIPPEEPRLREDRQCLCQDPACGPHGRGEEDARYRATGERVPSQDAEERKRPAGTGREETQYPTGLRWENRHHRRGWREWLQDQAGRHRGRGALLCGGTQGPLRHLQQTGS